MAILSSKLFIDKSFHRQDIIQIGHFINKTFHRQDIIQIGHFIHKTFHRQRRFFIDRGDFFNDIFFSFFHLHIFPCLQQILSYRSCLPSTVSEKQLRNCNFSNFVVRISNKSPEHFLSTKALLVIAIILRCPLSSFMKNLRKQISQINISSVSGNLFCL